MKSMIFSKLRCFISHEKGAALAELAILVPFLILMVAAVAEFGRFFQNYTTISKGTRSAARYLSNHKYDVDSQAAARNIVVCGKLTCAGGDALVPGLSTANVCIETTGTPRIETFTVSLPRVSGGGCGAPLNYTPWFNIGALLNTGFTFTPAISPSTTMYNMLD
ncbi:MAG TPA: TadE family protein [Pyrinomonadaceae bacterium]